MITSLSYYGGFFVLLRSIFSYNVLGDKNEEIDKCLFKIKKC